VPLLAAYLWAWWRYLGGAEPLAASAGARRAGRRANPLPRAVWGWALTTGALGVVALVLALRLLARVVVLPAQRLPDLAGVPRATVLALLVAAAPVAGLVEKTAFRGYMQRPLERRHGAGVAVLITGTMFALAHLDFTPVLWPYYVAVAAIYGAVTWRTDSTPPAVALHTAGILYSNLALWWHGRAEWQAGPPPPGAGDAGAAAWWAGVALVGVTAAGAWAYRASRGRWRVAPSRRSGRAPAPPRDARRRTRPTDGGAPLAPALPRR
jgi:membrane protease YdiL (CAAX protease family)